jgi:hypothetical protein
MNVDPVYALFSLGLSGAIVWRPTQLEIECALELRCVHLMRVESIDEPD